MSGRLDQPLKRKKPTIYFVNSMSDLFHEEVPYTFHEVGTVQAKRKLTPRNHPIFALYLH